MKFGSSSLGYSNPPILSASNKFSFGFAIRAPTARCILGSPFRPIFVELRKEVGDVSVSFSIVKLLSQCNGANGKLVGFHSKCSLKRNGLDGRLFPLLMSIFRIPSSEARDSHTHYQVQFTTVCWSLECESYKFTVDGQHEHTVF